MAALVAAGGLVEESGPEVEIRHSRRPATFRCVGYGPPAGSRPVSPSWI